MFAREFDAALPEQMDRPQPVSRELEIDLENLIRLNRHFGSHRLVLGFLRRWMKPGGSYRLLDLCTGAGDIPRLAIDWARANGVKLEIEAIDFQASTLEIARRWSAGYPEIAFRQGNALDLGDAPRRDFVFCSLALHHFSETDAAAILASCARLATRAALVADLERGWLARMGVWLVTALLYREPMTRFDARLSVRRAFSYGELAALAHRAGWAGFGQARFPIARQAIWLDKESI